MRFYRDNEVSAGTTIYGIGASGIFKCGNSYTADWTDCEDDYTTDNLGAVTGFYQESDGTKYILAQYGSSDTYKVYKENTPNSLVSLDLSGGTDEEIGDAMPASQLIVQSYEESQTTYYRIWIGTNAYGLMFKDTNGGSWTQKSLPSDSLFTLMGWGKKQR